MGQLMVDREWWNKLPKAEQAKVLELAGQDSYIGHERVKQAVRSVSKLYSTVHH